MFRFGGMHEEEEEDKGSGANGKVDVEAPPPSHLVGKGATKQRSNDGRNAKHHAKKRLEHGSLAERYHGDHGHHGSGKDSRTTNAGNGPPNDEGSGVGSGAADCGADFKDDDGDEKGPSDAVEAIDAAKEELTSGGGEHVCRAVPTDIAQALELVSDSRHCGGHNGSVESNKEHRNEDGEDDEPELQRLGLIILLCFRVVSRPILCGFLHLWF